MSRRATFEEWAAGPGRDLQLARHPDPVSPKGWPGGYEGAYMDSLTQLCWEAWQAGERASVMDALAEAE